jgi:rRNA processing protein Krr1/Pno1
MGTIRNCQSQKRISTMKSRIYRVTEIATNKVRIIEATSVAHAMKHVAETTHTCSVCNGIEAVKLIAEGVKFESAVNAKLTGVPPTDATKGG